ncbi:MAG: cation-translocating P-type ATPase [Burkholderiales bacterium]
MARTADRAVARTTEAPPAPPADGAHVVPVPDLLARLDASESGLAAAEAARRLHEYGPNRLQAARAPGAWTLLGRQFRNVLVIILLIATGLSAVLGHGTEAIAIVVIVLFAVLFGFAQEYRAEKALAALRAMAPPRAAVLRAGAEVVVPADEVVPGDVLVLRAGDRVAADGRLLSAAQLAAAEGVLTGESEPVAKDAAATPAPDAPVADRINLVYAGTAIASGRGHALVTATGMHTEFGRIAALLGTVEAARTPLQANLDRLGAALARVAFAIVAVIVVLGLVQGKPVIDMLVFGIALAVAVVPEALPAVVTISLALGVQRLVRRRALVRRLAAVEALGSTSVICTDKTGTLTRDEMTARVLVVPGDRVAVDGAGYAPAGRFLRDGVPVPPSEAVLQLLRAAVLASDARLARGEDGRHLVQGDPTEGALVVAAAKAGLDADALAAECPRIHEIPFGSDRKRMTTLHRTSGGVVAYAKGAPEVLLPDCTTQATAAGVEPFTDAVRAEWLATAQALADEALRVLAVARRAEATPGNAERGLTFLGLVGMIDPPRPEAGPALAKCGTAGIRVVMITGDHPRTAHAVAREIGLLAHGRVATGAEMAALDDAAFARALDEVAVHARVSPAHKLRVVTALQRQGHVVAMTGDGVNDAPALKKADIGVAMGVSGTDVAREAAAMLLTDDNFASIVAAVEEGRGIFGNIRKYLTFLLSSNVGEIGLMAGAMIAGLPLPLTAVQILYVNLATDGLPALALAVDPPEEDLMRRPPRDPKRGLFPPPVLAVMLAAGLWSSAVNLGLFAWALAAGRSLPEAMTMTFACLVLIQLCNAYNFRSDRRSLFRRPLANRWLNAAVAWEAALLAVILAWPVLHAPFGNAPVAAQDWLVVIAAAVSIVPVVEAAKALARRGAFGKF